MTSRIYVQGDGAGSILCVKAVACTMTLGWRRQRAPALALIDGQSYSGERVPQFRSIDVARAVDVEFGKGLADVIRHGERWHLLCLSSGWGASTPRTPTVRLRAVAALAGIELSSAELKLSTLRCAKGTSDWSGAVDT